MKKIVILACLFCMIALACPAQEWSLSLSSNVELRTWKLSTKADKDERGLGGASIKLFKGSTMLSEVKSLPNGDFKIEVPGNGEFQLEVSYPGCNTKKFAISTLGVPADISKDNFRPSYGIGGFIMAKPLPGVDYSYLSQALVKVVYLNRGKFEDDNSITERSLKAVSKINEAENALIEKFCTANRDGDAALNKPDCPLAKTLYEKAIALIPGEAYPAQQLPKVGKCLKDKEEADKKAKEEAAKTAATKQDIDKKAVDDAVAKAKADKAAKEQEMNDKLAKAAEEQAKKKAAADKTQKAAEPPKTAANPQSTATNDPKPKNSIIKIKEKSEEDLEADKRRAGKAKSNTEDADDIKLDAEKAAAKKAEKDKKYKEHLAKEQEEEIKREEERRIKEKEHLEKEAKEQMAKDEEQRKKREDQEAKDKEEAKKQAEEEAVRAKQDQEAREKEEAERASKENEQRKKTYEKLEEKKNNGKGNASYSIPAPLGSGNTYKEKIKKADELFNKKQYAEAKTVYEEALKQKPNDEYATAKVAEIGKLMTPEPPKQQ